MTDDARILTVETGMPPPARRLLNLVQRVLRCSPQVARREISGGHVVVNRRTVRDPEQVLQSGDRLEVYPTPVGRLSASPREEWRIVHADAQLIVVEKPAGLLTVPSPHRERRTMIALLTRHLQEENPASQAFSVHRLDRDVSGLLVFARSLAVAQQIRDQFASRKPEREYRALVAGRMAQQQGTVRSFLATDDQLNRFSVETSAEGELAITHFQLLRQFADAAELSVTLETGRRNQIRVHLAELNHPIIGETRYRSEQARHRDWPFRRLALHATRLVFRHPLTGERMEFESPLPAPFHHFFRAQARPPRNR